MPLNAAQKEMITSSIEHLIEYPSDHGAFQKQLDQYQRIFLNQSFENEADNEEVTTFNDIYKNPTQYLNRLETCSRDRLTVGEVRHYMIEYIFSQLTNHAKDIHFSLQEPNWCLNDFLKTDVFSDHATDFTSESLDFDVEEDPSRLDTRGRLFDASFSVDQAQLCVILSVRVNFDDPHHRSAKRILLNQFPAEDPLDLSHLYSNESRDFLLQHATEMAASNIVKRWHLPVWIEGRGGRVTSGAKLMTYPLYFRALQRRKISPSYLSRLHPMQEAVLTSPFVISLIQNERCSFLQAKMLSRWALNVISNPFYHQAILDGFLEINDLDRLSKEKAYLLNLPCVIRLLSTYTITFQQAMAMSVPTSNLLKNAFYSNRLENSEIFWCDIATLTADEMKMLSHESVMRLIGENIVSLREAKQFSVYAPVYLYHFLTLLSHDVLEEAHFYLFGMQLNSELLSANKQFTFDYAPIVEACEHTVKDRLVAILLGHPKLLSNQSVDSITQLKHSCDEFDIDFANIKSQVIEEVIEEQSMQRQAKFSPYIETVEVLGDATHRLFSEMLGMRLFSIYQGRPMIMNHHPDTVQLISQSLEEMAILISVDDLRDRAIESFLKKVQNDSFLSELNDRIFQQRCFRKCLDDSIREAEQNHPSQPFAWCHAMNQIAKECRGWQVKTVSTPKAFFEKQPMAQVNSSKRVYARLQEIYAHMVELSQVSQCTALWVTPHC